MIPACPHAPTQGPEGWHSLMRPRPDAQRWAFVANLGCWSRKSDDIPDIGGAACKPAMVEHHSKLLIIAYADKLATHLPWSKTGFPKFSVQQGTGLQELGVLFFLLPGQGSAKLSASWALGQLQLPTKDNLGSPRTGLHNKG